MFSTAQPEYSGIVVTLDYTAAPKRVYANSATTAANALAGSAAWLIGRPITK